MHNHQQNIADERHSTQGRMADHDALSKSLGHCPYATLNKKSAKEKEIQENSSLPLMGR